MVKYVTIENIDTQAILVIEVNIVINATIGTT
jgi:hypothetical protein